LSSAGYEPIRKLNATDSVETFDCGQPPLDHFLQRYALINQRANGSHTYVCCISGQVVGYYSLTVGSVDHALAPERTVKGMARHPVPVMILARLAVALTHQGKGLGRALLKDAMLRTLQAADIAGIRVLLVHAKDDTARQRYANWEFEASPTDPYHLFLLLKDLTAMIGK